MRRDLAAAHQESGPVLDEAKSLLDQKRQTDEKAVLLRAAQQRFLLSPEVLAQLTDPSVSVDSSFFEALTLAKRVYHDCEILLGCENQRLGTELMEQCAKDLESAFQKLYRWVQRQLKTINLEKPQIGNLTRLALRTLSERPTLFQNCLDTFAESRNRALLEAFHSALTGVASVDRPIESSAHDPVRYVGDMLAWAHSAVVSEHESLETLFIAEEDDLRKGMELGQSAEPWVSTETFDGRRALQQLVDRATEGICRMLKQKIDQLLHSHQEMVLLFQLSRILAFYQLTFSSLVVAESLLLSTLAASISTCLERFRQATKTSVAAVINSLKSVPADLQVPVELRDILRDLRFLMKSAEDDVPLELVTRPLVQHCVEIVESLPEPDSSVYLLNCLQAVESTQALGELEEAISAARDRLVEFEHAFYLQMSGIQPLLGEEGGISGDRLHHASQVLDDFLPSASMDAAGNVRLLNDSRLAQTILKEAAERFCQDFARLEAALDGRQEFPRTTDEIRVLLA